MSKETTNQFSSTAEKNSQLTRKSKAYTGSGHWEINSGAVEQPLVHPYLFGVQANTTVGLWDFHAIPKAQVGPGELQVFLEEMERRHRVLPLRWKTRNVSFVIRVREATPQASNESLAMIESHPEADESARDDWRFSPSKLLAKLQDPVTIRSELFDAILFAEVAEFNAKQTEQIIPLLLAFVNEHRLSQEDALKTVVGAAIRKLAMNLQFAQIDRYAELFLPTDTDTLPCEIELELAKAIVWRMTTMPAILSHRCPTLETRLSELAIDYLKPRLILQKNYASVALHAAVGVLLLKGEHVDAVAESVNKLGIAWFTELLRRRMEKVCSQLLEHGYDDAETVAAQLRRFDPNSSSKLPEGDTTECQLGD